MELYTEQDICDTISDAIGDAISIGKCKIIHA